LLPARWAAFPMLLAEQSPFRQTAPYYLYNMPQEPHTTLTGRLGVYDLASGRRDVLSEQGGQDWGGKEKV
jgi:hypothetical protein